MIFNLFILFIIWFEYTKSKFFLFETFQKENSYATITDYMDYGSDYKNKADKGTKKGNCFKFCRNINKNPIQPVCGRFKSGAKKGTFKLFKNPCFLRCTTNAYKVKNAKCDERVWKLKLN